MVLPAVTSYDKLLPLVGALAVAICAAAGVDATDWVKAIIGVALVFTPVYVYYKKNKGISYNVASKFITALPAAIAGVLILLNVTDVVNITHQLDQVGQSVLGLLVFITAGVGNSGAVLDQ